MTYVRMAPVMDDSTTKIWLMPLRGDSRRPANDVVATAASAVADKGCVRNKLVSVTKLKASVHCGTTPPRRTASPQPR